MLIVSYDMFVLECDMFVLEFDMFMFVFRFSDVCFVTILACLCRISNEHDFFPLPCVDAIYKINSKQTYLSHQKNKIH